MFSLTWELAYRRNIIDNIDRAESGMNELFAALAELDRQRSALEILPAGADGQDIFDAIRKSIEKLR